MDSATLNERIQELCDDTTHFEAFGGKSIPYIGWYWRTVDFDSPVCVFGICDGKVGFMENNKWGYDEIYATGEQWEHIKALLVTAVESPSRRSLFDVYDAIQSLNEGA